MRIKIVDDPVRHNVELFLDILRRFKEKQRTREIPVKNVFKAYLHRQTGQLFFDEVMKETLILGQKDWKPIQLSYTYDPTVGNLRILLEDEEAFRAADLTPHAFKILQSTMKVFQDLSNKLQGPSDLETKIAVLAKLHINAEANPTDQNVLFQAWHYMDRMQAENLLLDKPVGTYLFRKDPYAGLLEQELEKQLGFKLKCFTLTYSKQDQQICDCTILHANGVWQIYDDDPSLNQRNFSSLVELLNTFETDLRFPLYHG